MLHAPQCLAGQSLASAHACVAPTSHRRARGTSERTTLQDRERSDSMAPVCEVAQLNGLLRRAVNLMRGVDIKMTPLGIGIGAISVIPVLKIFERCVRPAVALSLAACTALNGQSLLRCLHVW